MIVSIKDFFVEISESLEKFMVTYSDQPLLWLVVFGVLLAIALYGISTLANK